MSKSEFELDHDEFPYTSTNIQFIYKIKHDRNLYILRSNE